MKKLNIKMDHAVLESFNIDLAEDRPHVNINIGLYAKGRKDRIAQYQISTETYYEGRKFALPIEAMFHIRELMDIFEAVASRHANGDHLKLASPKMPVQVVDEEAL